MQAALHQYARTTQCNRFVDLLTDFIERANVCIGGPGSAIERAERTHDVTHVRVIDVAINDVRDDVARMSARSDLICGSTHLGDVVRLEEIRALVGGHALACKHSVENSDSF